MSTLTTTWDGRLGRAAGSGSACGTGRGIVARAAGRLLGLRGGRAVPATLTIESAVGGERWTRRFGRRTWSTTCVRTPTGITEWVGPLHRRHLVGLDLAIGGTAERATLRLQALRLGPWALPPAGVHLAATVERQQEALAFAATVSVVGCTVVAYEGWVR
jgi:hypothetical protein